MLLLSVLPLITRFEKPQTNTGSVKTKLIKGAQAANYKPYWWLRLTTAAVLGFPLATGISGLLVWWGPGGPTDDAKTQLVMWLVTPLWLLPLSLVFFIRNPLRAISSYVVLTAVISALHIYAKI